MIAVNARFLTQPLTGVQRFALERSRALQSLCGKNNILFIENGVNIQDSTFYYEGDNSVIYVSKNKNK